MKGLMVLLVATFALLTTTSNVLTQAQNPREDLQQLVMQLQKTPTDNALREKIIKLVVDMNPAPTIPDEAIEYEGRAQAAFKTASKTEDYLTAANEYRKAVALAPWVKGYYSDLCTIYEKAGVYFEAKRNCQFASLGDADPAAVTDSKRRIAGLNFLIEKFSKDKLSAQLTEPFSTNIPDMPSGKRYFCSARWDFPFGMGYTHNPGEPDVGGRRESWIVYDGKTMNSGSVLWAEPESLAAFVLYARSASYSAPVFVNPTVWMNADDPYPGVSGQFYTQGVTSFYTRQVSADGQSVTVIQRSGSPDKPREEQSRWTCSLK